MPGEPPGYRQALGMANDARRRAFARAGQLRFEVAVRRALGGRRRWYSRWYRPPRGSEPFTDAVGRALREDPAYTEAVGEMVRCLDLAVRHARQYRQQGDDVLRGLLRQLVVLLRPLMGEQAAVHRVAALVLRHSTGPVGIPGPRASAPHRDDRGRSG
jgi:hypothetical protein